MNSSLMRLGFRLAFLPGYPALVRRGLLFLGIGLCGLVFLICLAIPGAVTDQAARFRELTPDLGEEPQVSSLMAIDPVASSSRRWEGHVVERLLVAKTGAPRNLRIPGVSGVPEAGEAYVSPRLQELIPREPVLADLFSTYRVVGTIDEDGLTSPYELRAVIGVPRTTSGLLPIERFGGAPQDERTANYVARLNTVVGIVVGILLMLSAGSLVVLCVRLGGRQRRDRVFSLRRLGVSRNAIRAILVVEVLLVAVPGLAFSALTFLLFRITADHVPGTQIGFFTDHLRPPVGQAVGALLVILMLVMVAGAMGVQVDESGGRAHGPSRGARLAYPTGIAGLVCFIAVGVLPDGVWKATGLWCGIGLLSAGIAMSANGIVAASSRVMARTAARRAGTLVGLRINGAEPGTTTRLAGSLAALIVALAGVSSFLTILGASASGHNVGRETVATVSDYYSMLNIDDVRAADGVQTALPIYYLEGNRDTVLALVGSCDDLDDLLGVNLSSCPAKPVWIGGGAGVAAESSRAVLDDLTLELPSRKQRLQLPAPLPAVEGLLFLPPRFLVGRNSPASRYVIRMESDTRVRTIAQISSRAPAAGFEVGGAGSTDEDVSDNSEQIEWLLVGAGVAGILTCLALTTGVLGESEARRKRLRGMYVLGAGATDLTRAHVASVFLPLFITALAGLAGAVISGLAVYLYDDRAELSFGFFFATASLTLVACLLITALTLPSAVRAWSPDE